MKYIENIKQTILNKDFKSKVIFFLGALIYIALTYTFFLYDFKGNDYINSGFKYSTYILNNLERNLHEKGLIIKFENNTYTLNKEEPFYLENYDKRISSNKNLLFISKNAEDKDFKEKDTLMILNSNELKINLEPGPLVYPIENLKSITSEISSKEIKDFNQKFFIGSDLYNIVALNLIVILKSLEIIVLLILGNFLLPFLAYCILYVSGYKNANSLNYKSNSLIAIGIFMIIKPVIVTFAFEPSFISVLLILAGAISIIEKGKLEKKLNN